jgi:predicted DNA-binding protein
MNKKYMVSLPEEKTEELKAWLEAHGMTLSVYLGGVIEEQLETMKIIKVPDDVSKMTVGDFVRMAGKLMVNLSKARGATKRKK